MVFFAKLPKRTPHGACFFEYEDVQTMLYWFIISAVGAAMAGTLSVGITATSVGVAQVLLMMVCAMVVISLFTGVMRRVL